MATRAYSAASIAALALALAVLPACSKKQPKSAAGQNNAQPSQSTAPSVVEQPDSTGPILQDDQNSALTGLDASTEEGPLKRVHFEYDQAGINSEAQSILSGNATYLKSNAATFIRIEGHCDDRGSVEYNQALGERRANSAKEMLVALGIDSKRLDTISYGEDRPISFEHTEYGWALNRRAEFRILSE